MPTFLLPRGLKKKKKKQLLELIENALTGQEAVETNLVALSVSQGYYLCLLIAKHYERKTQ